MTWRSGDLSVNIDGSVTSAIRAAYDAALPCEVGGLLFGTYPSSCSVRVSDVLMCPAGGLAEFERTSPDPKDVQTLWDRGLFFVGDWHSHPMSDPCPSGIDIRTMIETAEDPDAKCPAPIMLIVGETESMTGILDGNVVFFERAAQ